jgi:hypothetical protein
VAGSVGAKEQLLFESAKLFERKRVFVDKITALLYKKDVEKRTAATKDCSCCCRICRC